MRLSGWCRHPAGYIGQGYLTVTYPLDDLPTAIAQAVESHLEWLEDFEIDAVLLEAMEKERLPATFRMYRNNEVAFDGNGDAGYKGFGLNVAFSPERAVALVAYIGPGLPTIVRRYECSSADGAVAMWQLDWAAPLVLSPVSPDEGTRHWKVDAISGLAGFRCS